MGWLKEILSVILIIGSVASAIGVPFNPIVCIPTLFSCLLSWVILQTAYKIYENTEILCSNTVKIGKTLEKIADALTDAPKDKNKEEKSD